jgi:hypothetical protein
MYYFFFLLSFLFLHSLRFLDEGANTIAVYKFRVLGASKLFGFSIADSGLSTGIDENYP